MIFGGRVFFAQVTVKSGIRGYNAELVGNGDAIDIIDVIGGYK